jgi:putative membrane protein
LRETKRTVARVYFSGGFGVKAGFIVLVAAAVCACAQQVPGQDDKFVSRTAQANLAEVQLSAWAEDHALSDEVKQFASELVDYQTTLADDLRPIAAKQNALQVSDLDPKDSAEIERLKTLEPNLLDRAYMREIMKWHQREVDALKREMELGRNPELRYFAYEMLPAVEAHIKEGEDTERAIGMDVQEKVAANAIVK